jgi:hypothetical protein
LDAAQLGQNDLECSRMFAVTAVKSQMSAAAKVHKVHSPARAGARARAMPAVFQFSWLASNRIAHQAAWITGAGL